MIHFDSAIFVTLIADIPPLLAYILVIEMKNEEDKCLIHGFLIQQSHYERMSQRQQALDICAGPLLEAEIITADYLSAIKTQHEKLGPYYVTALGWPCRMPDQKKEQKD